MTKTSIIIITYVLGLFFGALVLGLWDAQTGPIALIGLAWTSLFMIALFYAEKKNSK
jgi:hypothetical protein